MIDLKNVSVTLASRAGPVDILRGIDLAVPAGARVGIVGPSGAGKSTLMMILAGLEKASGGQVHVAGADLSALNENQLAHWRRDHVGIVFQAFRLIPTMTAQENVAVPLELAGRSDAFARAQAALAAVGLGHRLDHYPEQLSGGEQQRTALARAIVAQPRLLLADEPTGNLDGTTGAKIIDMIFALTAQQATTLVLITHDSALAERCGRIIHLADGRIAADSGAC